MRRGQDRSAGGLLTLVGALGVVFGDIGTSPLYAMRTILGEGDRLDERTVYGLTSMVVWSLVLVVSVLYVSVLLRTSNEGEGGLLAVFALLRRSREGVGVAAAAVIAMIGAAMFLGDAVVTPAVSVLSAAEGLEVARPSLASAALPLAIVVLAGVFTLQRIGSGRIGVFYGPIMAVWFVVLAVGGTASLARTPAAAQALSPALAVEFFADDPVTAFLALGSVILAITGAEALYADLGHFGRAAITRAWFLLVLPALLLAYLGEAAAVVRQPAAAANPFYSVVASWATIPVLVLATLATVIASEAVIAGAFTVLHQAGGLGFFPYLRTRHPSPDEGTRIYVPAANWALAAAVLAVVVTFGSSERLASAYGVAVSATIVMTVILFIMLTRSRNGDRNLERAVGFGGLAVMLAFLAAALPKIPSGGWAPVGVGAALFAVMWTWRTGQARLAAARAESDESARELLGSLNDRGQTLHRTRQTAVFLTEDKEVAPFPLRTIVETACVLPERVVLLSWCVKDTPHASGHDAAVEIDAFDEGPSGVVGVSVVLGYRERLSVQHVLEEARRHDPAHLRDVDPESASYFLSEAIPRLAKDREMATWRQRVFLVLDRLATDRVEQLALPRDRTIAVGREFDL